MVLSLTAGVFFFLINYNFSVLYFIFTSHVAKCNCKSLFQERCVGIFLSLCAPENISLLSLHLKARLAEFGVMTFSFRVVVFGT